ncbi:MAG: DUF5686 family protein [Bacteroidales bacterium]
MRDIFIFLWTFLLLVSPVELLHGQTTIEGRVSDAGTGEPLAFANISAPGLNKGTTTDIDGNFSITFKKPVDSFLVTYVGYKRKVVYAQKEKQHYNITLKATEFDLSEVTITPGKNPAHRIIVKAIENRDTNNPESEGAFVLKTYNKLIAKPDKDFMRRDKSIADSVKQNIREQFSDKHLFIMESVSQRFFKAPDRVKEKILHTQVSGLQNPFFFMLATQLQSFTFYDDLINIGGYRMVNPISRGSTKKYWFRIEDTTYVKGPQDTVFTISFRKRGDRSFSGMQGVIQIGSEDFAIRSVIASPAKEQPSQSGTKETGGTNEQAQQELSIKIQQKYKKVEGKKWLPEQLNTDIVAPGISLAGVPVKIEGRTYIQDVELKDDIPNRVFDENYLEMNENAAVRNDSMIRVYRAGNAMEIDKNTYDFIDSLSEAENLERKITFLRILMDGHIPWGPVSFDLDKLPTFNIYEGWRLGAGISTNERFSKVIRLSGYAGWGTKDHRWKYGGALNVRLWDAHDVYMNAEYKNDIREFGRLPAKRSTGLLDESGYRDYLVSRFDREELTELSLEFRVLNFAEITTGIRHRDLTFFDNYRFVSNNEYATIGLDGIRTCELFAGLRYAFRERYIKTPLGKTSLGSKYPVFWLDYTRGMDMLKGQLEYEKFDFQAQGDFYTKYYGTISFVVRAGTASENIPLSLQYAGFGSSDNFNVDCPGSFNTMDINEFGANTYAAVFLEHDFKKHLFRSQYFQPSLKLRTSVLWGSRGASDYHANISYKSPEKGYFESGLLIDELFKSSFSSVGLGFYYRYGPYNQGKLLDDLAVKLVIGLGI